MPANPNKRPCSRPGFPAWAMRDSDPPICNIHAGRARPPRGNQNARKHGFYSPMIPSAELRALPENIDELIIVPSSFQIFFPRREGGTPCEKHPKE